jgi:hypothetical protein
MMHNTCSLWRCGTAWRPPPLRPPVPCPPPPPPPRPHPHPMRRAAPCSRRGPPTPHPPTPPPPARRRGSQPRLPRRAARPAELGSRPRGTRRLRPGRRMRCWRRRAGGGTRARRARTRATWWGRIPGRGDGHHGGGGAGGAGARGGGRRRGRGWRGGGRRGGGGGDGRCGQRQEGPGRRRGSRRRRRGGRRWGRGGQEAAQAVRWGAGRGWPPWGEQGWGGRGRCVPRRLRGRRASGHPAAFIVAVMGPSWGRMASGAQAVKLPRVVACTGSLCVCTHWEPVTLHFAGGLPAQLSSLASGSIEHAAPTPFCAAGRRPPSTARDGGIATACRRRM